MNFRQLEYVLEVDRCGSINKAAQVLFVSQPAVSSAVRELEAELGFPVFTRSSRGITTTMEGRKFITGRSSASSMRSAGGARTPSGRRRWFCGSPAAGIPFCRRR